KTHPQPRPLPEQEQTMSHEDLLRFDEPIDLEVRDLERREIAGRVIPFGEQIQIRGRPESFAPGVTSGIDITKTKLLLHHDPSKPVGRGVALEERADGAYAVFRVSKTQMGDEALELAKDGLQIGRAHV